MPKAGNQFPIHARLKSDANAAKYYKFRQIMKNMLVLAWMILSHLTDRLAIARLRFDVPSLGLSAS